MTPATKGMTTIRSLRQRQGIDKGCSSMFQAFLTNTSRKDFLMNDRNIQSDIPTDIPSDEPTQNSTIRPRRAVRRLLISAMTVCTAIPLFVACSTANDVDPQALDQTVAVSAVSATNQAQAKAGLSPKPVAAEATIAPTPPTES